MRTGTDMLAVACIVGGGLIAGGVTLALASGPALPSLECATTVGPEADVVVRLGGEGLVVVTPETRVREVKECMAAEGITQARLDELRGAVRLGRGEEIERARREADRARREVERVRREVDRVRERTRVGERTAVATREARAVEQRARARAEREAARAEREAAGAERQAARAAREAARAARVAATAEREQARVVRERVRAGVEPERIIARIDRARLEARMRAAREALAGIDLDEVGLDEASLDEVVTGSLSEGLRIALPGRTFEVRFQGLEDVQLDGTDTEDALRLRLQVLEGLDLDLEGIDEELAREIEVRLEEERAELREQLERLEGGSGR